jgi:hypothetical protein
LVRSAETVATVSQSEEAPPGMMGPVARPAVREAVGVTVRLV